MIYLDNAATTQMSEEVLDAMLPYLKEGYGNAGALYGFGRESAVAVRSARGEVARLFGCTPDHVVFTSSGSEGNNMILKGVRNRLLKTGKTHLIISATEHDSVLKAAEMLIKDGFYVSFLKPNQDGNITSDMVEEVLQKDTGLVSVMFSNNETGSVNDVTNIGKLCRRHSVLFHSDCVQAAGQFPLNVEENNIDFATISAHKIHGPKGIGAVYIRDFDIDPLICGGSNQEFGVRGGTENVAGIVGFGVAAAAAIDHIRETMIHVSSLKQIFIAELSQSLPYENLKEAGVYFNAYTYLNPGKILSMRIDGVFGESLVLMLDSMGVCISSGSACASHEAAPSHVLIAHGLTATEARCSVRVSFSAYNTEEEVKAAAVAMATCIESMRFAKEVGFD